MFKPRKRRKFIPLCLAPTHPLLRQGRQPGKPIHRATLERWRTRGVRGVVLETFLLGGIRVTTEAAIRRFLETLSKPNLPAAGPGVPSQNTDHQRALRECESEGL